MSVIFSPEPVIANLMAPRGSKDNRRAQTLVTAYANLVDDSMRQDIPIQGDGLPPSSMVGFWPASTNLITNGGFTSNTTGWNNVSIATLTRITTQLKFGVACGEVVTSNAAANEGCYHNFTATVAVYSLSCWVRGAGGGTVRLAVRDNAGANAQTGSAATLTSTWQKIALVTTNLTAATWRMYVETSAQQSITFQFDGAQAELQPKPSPYLETDGATVARGTNSLRLPVRTMTGIQGWLAMRVQFPYQSGATYPSTFPDFFKWSDDGTHQVEGYYDRGGAVLRLDRSNGGLNQKALAISWADGATKTLIFKWDVNNLALSIDGGNFSTSNLTIAPTLAATDFKIGTATAFYNVFWVATGSGGLTNGEAATIGALGNIGNQPASFPGSCKLYWQGLNTKVLTAV